MKEKIIIIGDGGHARMIQDFIEEENRYQIIGVTSKNQAREDFFGYPILGPDEVLVNYYTKGIKKVAIGIGGFTNNESRKKAFIMAKAIGFEVLTIIHNSAVVSKYACIGEGTVIMPNVTINNDVKIGLNCVIANGAVISHESIIGDHVLISAGSIVGGYTRIGEGSLLALGSNVISGVIIGNNTLVAAGAVAVTNIGDNKKVFGVPAKEKNM